MSLDPAVERFTQVQSGDAADLAEARRLMVGKLGLTLDEAADLTVSALTALLLKRLCHMETRIAWSCPTYSTEI